MAITGSATADIDAPIAEVYAIAADPVGSPRWQPEFKAAEALEHDAEGRAVLVRFKTDLKVRTIDSDVRFTFDDPVGIRLHQVSGPLKSVDGGWTLEDLGDGRTRATFALEIELGRTLGLVIRGPLVGLLRGQLVESMPDKLKRFVEAQ